MRLLLLFFVYENVSKTRNSRGEGINVFSFFIKITIRHCWRDFCVTQRTSYHLLFFFLEKEFKLERGEEWMGGIMSHQRAIHTHSVDQSWIRTHTNRWIVSKDSLVYIVGFTSLSCKTINRTCTHSKSPPSFFRLLNGYALGSSMHFIKPCSLKLLLWVYTQNNVAVGSREF